MYFATFTWWSFGCKKIQTNRELNQDIKKVDIFNVQRLCLLDFFNQL